MKPLLIFSCISSPVFSVCIFSCRGGQTINALIDLIILSLDDMMFQWLYIGSVTKKKDVQACFCPKQTAPQADFRKDYT